MKNGSVGLAVSEPFFRNATVVMSHGSQNGEVSEWGEVSWQKKTPKNKKTPRTRPRMGAGGHRWLCFGTLDSRQQTSDRTLLELVLI